jgi:hypothetical protein
LFAWNAVVVGMGGVWLLIQTLGLASLAKVLFLEVSVYAVWCLTAKPFLLAFAAKKLNSKILLRYYSWLIPICWRSIMVSALI